jgi:transcriptional antiterminator NusG
MAEFNWYVLRAVSGQERKVKAYIESELIRQNLSQFVPELLIPSEKIYEMRNGKKTVRDKIFFPGYILISADLNNGETLHVLNNTPGAIGFLGEGKTKANKKPEPLRLSEINRILGRVEEGNIAQKLNLSPESLSKLWMALSVVLLEISRPFMMIRKN